MARIEFTILGDPRAQKRHRTFQPPGKKFTVRYDPSKCEKRDFLLAVQHNAPEVPFKEPLAVELLFCMPRPNNHYGTGRNAGILKHSSPKLHDKNPDIDNLMKFVLDALNNVFWRDDSIICQLKAEKIYDERPRTEIVIETLNEREKSDD